MSSSVFLDTSGWLTLLNANESQHARGLEIWLELMNQGRQVVLTDWIIAETGNGLARSRTKDQFVAVADQIMDAPGTEVVIVDRNLLQRALARYAKFADKSWGLVDCASFALMEEREIKDAFSSDGDFVQAEFNCLLPA
jgi:predicted nucleic acid-binding protein